MRQSKYDPGQSIDIDGIMAAFGAAGGDASKLKIGGKGMGEKIASTLESLKEALGFGQAVGDAHNSTIGVSNKVDNSEKGKAKFTKEGWDAARDRSIDKTQGWTSAGSSIKPDSSSGVIDYYNKNEKVKSDTLKPNP